MSPTSLLRLRRFGSAAARDAAYAADPGLATRPYREQQEALDRSFGPFSAPLSAELERQGWAASDLVLGVPEVRAAWEREYGPLPLVSGIDDPDVRLAIGEIRRSAPEVVLEGNLNVLDRRTMALLRAEPQPPRLLVGQLGTAKRFHRAVDLDVVLVPCPSIAHVIAPWMRGQVHVLPHSFNPAILTALPERTVAHPLMFAGALGPRYVLRHELLMALLETTPIEAWTGVRKGVVRADGMLTTPSERAGGTLLGQVIRALPTTVLVAAARRDERFAAALNVRLATRAGARIVDAGPLEDPAARFPERCHAAVGGREYFQLLRSAGTVFHREGDELDGCGAALRLFEVTGLGATLLVDGSPMVEQLFADDEVVTYAGVDDCIEKATWLIEHPADAERIAAAGQARTLRDHTTEVRARQLAQILEGALRGR